MNNRRLHSKKQPSRNYADSEENPGDYGAPISSLQLLPPLPASSAAAPPPPHPPPPANVGRVLMDDLDDVFTLVESLMNEKKPSNSFTRRSSVIYTKTPSRDLSRKSIDARGANAAKSVPGRRRGDLTDKDQSKTSDNDVDGADELSPLKPVEQDSEELTALKQQTEDLQRKLLEKDELLKAAEDAKNQMSLLQANYDDLRQQAAQRESIVQSTEIDLSDAKIKLADKQAALEKAQWEAMTSKQKVDKLQEEIDSLQTQISSFMSVFELLAKDDPILDREDYEVEPYCMDPLPGIDDMDENEILEMEAATNSYLAAVAAAKENPDEESLQAAVNARLHLQSFVF